MSDQSDKPTRIARASLLIVMLAAAVGNAFGASSGGDQEAMLPKYCSEASQMNTNPRADDVARWSEILGPTLHHIHHYCLGLMAMNRARLQFNMPPQHRRGNWNAAVNEISYVIARAPEDFVLLPELYYRRGISLTKLDADAKAEKDFAKALELYPSYFVAAVELASLYRRQGRLDLARSTVDQGLNHRPDAKALLDLRRELGGPDRQAQRAPSSAAKSGAEPAKAEAGTAKPSPETAKAGTENPPSEQQP